MDNGGAHEPPPRELRFRPLARTDFPLLSTWMAEPTVARWWQEDHRAEAVEHHYGPSVDRTDPTEVAIVELASTPCGMIQRYRLVDNPDWRATLAPTGVPLDAFGIDYFIGVPDLLGRGLGPRLIDQFVHQSWRHFPDCSACVVGVDQSNRRSWRALEKVGFDRWWSGQLVSDDPSDAGPQFLYGQHRPAQPAPRA